MKRWLKTAAGVLVVFAIGGFLVAASGVIPITASSGHWPITRWLLRFGMERSTSTHSIGIEVPDLAQAGWVMKGAGHYEVGCRSCHGAPGSPPPKIARSMTPTPPDLGPRIRESDAAELFYVVKHGVKFTGMPAWPSQQRDDEVWAMVAFLRELPKLDAAAYQRLVRGEPPAAMADLGLQPPARSAGIPATVMQRCAACHGADGQGRAPGAFPKLAGQRREYLRAAIHAYAEGSRHSGIMEPLAEGLPAELIEKLAGYYAAMTPMQPASSAGQDRAAVERGRQIAEHGLPERRVPACVECHGPKGTRTKDNYPLLTGQDAAYLELQLQLFEEGKRGGSAYAHLMDEVVHGLEPEDRRAVARFFAQGVSDKLADRPTQPGEP